MTTAKIKKVLASVESLPTSIQLGERRLDSLPLPIRKDIVRAARTAGDPPISQYLDSLTEQEFENWLKLKLA